MIFEDLYKHFTEDAGVSAIATDGVFWRKPLQQPAGDPYLIYTRPDLGENDVRNQHRIEIVCFSKSMNDLEGLTEAVKASLRGVTQIGDGHYYMVQLINQVESDEKLDSGYYFSILNYYMRDVLP